MQPSLIFIFVGHLCDAVQEPDAFQEVLQSILKHTCATFECVPWSLHSTRHNLQMRERHAHSVSTRRLEPNDGELKSHMYVCNAWLLPAWHTRAETFSGEEGQVARTFHQMRSFSWRISRCVRAGYLFCRQLQFCRSGRLVRLSMRCCNPLPVSRACFERRSKHGL